MSSTFQPRSSQAAVGSTRRVRVVPHARGGAESPTMTFSIVELWGHMGMFARVINIFMAIMSVTTIVVLAERLILFRKSRNQSRQFAEKMAALLQKGDLAAAANANVGKDV